MPNLYNSLSLKVYNLTNTMKKNNYLKSLIAVILLISLPFVSLFAQGNDDYLNDIINLWNNKKYDKVFSPLKDYKASKKITGDFEIDYMIATSASRSGGDAKETKELIEGLLKDYSFSKEDVAYVTIQGTPEKYVMGKNARMDEERIANRGKIDEPTSKEVPKPTGKGTGKLEDSKDKKPADPKAGKDPKMTPGAAAGGNCADIIRKPNVTQIVKGDQVITVKAGWSYFVRGDSIITIAPPKPMKR